MRKYLAALSLLLAGANVEASVIYTWHTTSYDLLPSNVSASDLFSLNASWTLSDAAVARGRIQMISDGPQSEHPTPEDIIDFSMSAASLDGSRSYSWEKSDLPIKFERAQPWQEAYDTNLYVSATSVVMMDIWNSMKRDGYTFYGQDGFFEIFSPTGFLYAINGEWTTASVPEPGSLILLGIGLIGVGLATRQSRRKWERTRSAKKVFEGTKKRDGDLKNFRLA